MALTTDQYQQLMRFLDADMSTEELAAFEKELDAHPELQQQLNFELGVAGALAGKEEKASRAEIGKVVPIANHRWKYWVAAASIVVVAVSAYLLLSRPATDQSLVDRPDSTQVHGKDPLAIPPTPSITQRAPSPDSLFKQYYRLPELPDNLPMILSDAVIALEERNYKPIEDFDLHHLPTLRGGNDEKTTIKVAALFYKGIAAIQQQKNDSAIKLFLQIITDYPTHQWVPKAHWYMAMACLNKGDVTTAQQALTILKNDKQYGAKATLLLNALQQPA